MRGILAISVLVIGALSSPPVIVRQTVGSNIFFKTSSSNPKSFVIECEAAGDPKPEYHWTKNGKKLDITLNGNITQGDLSIKNPTADDEGQYTCFAKNKHGTAMSKEISVRRVFLENFKNESIIKTIEATEGDPFKLECEAPGGYPQPSVFWMIQTAQGSIKGIDNPRLTLDPFGNLWFSTVQREDASRDSYYVCSAASPVVNEYKLGNRIALKVIPLKKPNFQCPPKVQFVSPPTVIAMRDKPVELFCIYHGVPLPKITWSKDGKPLEDNERISLENYGKSLKIKKADATDEGKYECYASSNNAEDDTSSFDLKVESPPYVIVEPSSKNVSLKQPFEIACKVDGIPEPKISWFLNGKQIERADKHFKFDKYEIAVKEAKESDAGSYVCIATNSHGSAYRNVYIAVGTSSVK